MIFPSYNNYFCLHACFFMSEGMRESFPILLGKQKSWQSISQENQVIAEAATERCSLKFDDTKRADLEF